MSDAVIVGIVQTVVISMLVFWLQAKAKKRSDEVDKRSAAREKAGALAMKLEMVTGKLAFGCAVALEKGRANGEIKEAKSEFEKVKKEYLDFLNEEAFANINRKE